MTDPDEVAEPYAVVVAEGIQRLRREEPDAFHRWLYGAVRDLAAARNRPGDMPTLSDCLALTTLAMAAANAAVPFDQAVAWFRARENPPRDPWLVDEVAVERACGGQRLQLNALERREAVRRMTERGLSLKEIGRRLGMAHESVARHRAALRGEGGEAA